MISSTPKGIQIVVRYYFKTYTRYHKLVVIIFGSVIKGLSQMSYAEHSFSLPSPHPRCLKCLMRNWMSLIVVHLDVKRAKTTAFSDVLFSRLLLRQSKLAFAFFSCIQAKKFIWTNFWTNYGKV